MSNEPMRQRTSNNLVNYRGYNPVHEVDDVHRTLTSGIGPKNVGYTNTHHQNY